MPTFSFEGRIESITPKSVTGKDGTVYNSKEIIAVTVNEQYEQTYQVSVRERQFQAIDSLQVGSVVTLHTNVNGRSYTAKDGSTGVFMSLGFWKFETVGAQVAAPAPYTAVPPLPMPAATGAPVADGDLPF